MAIKSFPRLEKSLKRLQGALVLEFILGVLLTTVIEYEPDSTSTIQATVLIAHIVVAIALIAGSLAHIFMARKAQLLGAKPVIGFLFILGASSAGSVAARTGDETAVLIMALCFIAAMATYGRSLIGLAATGKK